MIKNIIFDFGGVLVDWDPRYFYSSVFEDRAEMEYFLREICSVEWNSRHDRGVLFADNISSLQAQHPRYSREIGLFRQGWGKMLRCEKPDTVAIMKELVEKGYDVYGLTNWSAETIEELYGRFPFFALMKGVVVSGEEKIIKPDTRIYRILLDRYGLRADECLFVDDNPENVAAAEKTGINGVRFTDSTALRQELVRRL